MVSIWVGSSWSVPMLVLPGSPVRLSSSGAVTEAAWFKMTSSVFSLVCAGCWLSRIPNRAAPGYFTRWQCSKKASSSRKVLFIVCLPPMCCDFPTVRANQRAKPMSSSEGTSRGNEYREARHWEPLRGQCATKNVHYVHFFLSNHGPQVLCCKMCTFCEV